MKGAADADIQFGPIEKGQISNPDFDLLCRWAEASDGQDGVAAECAERCDQLLSDWHCPLVDIRSASHTELFAMNVAHALGIMGPSGGLFDAGYASFARISCLRRDERWVDLLIPVCRFVMRLPYFSDEAKRDDALVAAHFDAANNACEFLRKWRAHSFARLELPHRLAAALCLTDADDADVRAPWEAWSLVVPGGLLPAIAIVRDGSRITRGVVRAWVTGVTVAFLVLDDGSVEPFGDVVPGGVIANAWTNLVRGASLALSNPGAVEHSRRSAASVSRAGRVGTPDLSQAHYVLSHPVKVDLRDHLSAVLAGREGVNPTVQFLVRGHWRRQPHGPARSRRKTIWIEPFWKGPIDGDILLRQHELEPPR